MSLQTFRERIELSIGSSTAEVRKSLVEEIINEGIPVASIADFLEYNHPVSMRLSWLLGDLSEANPAYAPAILTECVLRLPRIQIKNFDRTLSKQALICGVDIPEECEGFVISKLFDWLIDPQITVSTKNNSLFALEKLASKYPDLKGELVQIIKVHQNQSTVDFRKRAAKVLNRLQS